MRDRINRRLPRARRRAFLAAFISLSCGGSFTSADDPVSPGRLPPLPLESTGAMRQNPFCEPVTRDSLRLVSGSEEGRPGDATNRPLRPLRERVGLAPIRVAFGDDAPMGDRSDEVTRQSDTSSGPSGAPRRVGVTASPMTPDPVHRNPYTESSGEIEASSGGVSMSLGDIGGGKPAPSPSAAEPTRAAESTSEPKTPRRVSLGGSARVLKVPEVAGAAEASDVPVVQEAAELADVTDVANAFELADAAELADVAELANAAELAEAAGAAEVVDATPAVPMILEASPIRISREPEESNRIRRVAAPVTTMSVAPGDPNDRDGRSHGSGRG